MVERTARGRRGWARSGRGAPGRVAGRETGVGGIHKRCGVPELHVHASRVSPWSGKRTLYTPFWKPVRHSDLVVFRHVSVHSRPAWRRAPGRAPRRRRGATSWSVRDGPSKEELKGVKGGGSGGDAGERDHVHTSLSS